MSRPRNSSVTTATASTRYSSPVSTSATDATKASSGRHQHPQKSQGPAATAPASASSAGKGYAANQIYGRQFLPSTTPVLGANSQKPCVLPTPPEEPLKPGNAQKYGGRAGAHASVTSALKAARHGRAAASEAPKGRRSLPSATPVLFAAAATATGAIAGSRSAVPGARPMRSAAVSAAAAAAARDRHRASSSDEDDGEEDGAETDSPSSDENDEDAASRADRRPSGSAAAKHARKGALGASGPAAAENEDDIWSDEVERSFQEAYTRYPNQGRTKMKGLDGKLYGRNELIAQYIHQQTGKLRTRKQISSHIQVLVKKIHRAEKETPLPQRTPTKVARPRSAGDILADAYGKDILASASSSTRKRRKMKHTPNSRRAAGARRLFAPDARRAIGSAAAAVAECAESASAALGAEGASGSVQAGAGHDDFSFAFSSIYGDDDDDEEDEEYGNYDNEDCNDESASELGARTAGAARVVTPQTAKIRKAIRPATRPKLSCLTAGSNSLAGSAPTSASAAAAVAARQHGHGNCNVVYPHLAALFPQPLAQLDRMQSPFFVEPCSGGGKENASGNPFSFASIPASGRVMQQSLPLPPATGGHGHGHGHLAQHSLLSPIDVSFGDHTRIFGLAHPDLDLSGMLGQGHGHGASVGGAAASHGRVDGGGHALHWPRAGTAAAVPAQDLSTTAARMQELTISGFPAAAAGGDLVPIQLKASSEAAQPNVKLHEVTILVSDDAAAQSYRCRTSSIIETDRYHSVQAVTTVYSFGTPVLQYGQNIGSEQEQLELLKMGMSPRKSARLRTRRRIDSLNPTQKHDTWYFTLRHHHLDEYLRGFLQEFTSMGDDDNKKLLAQSFHADIALYESPPDQPQPQSQSQPDSQSQPRQEPTPQQSQSQHEHNVEAHGKEIMLVKLSFEAVTMAAINFEDYLAVSPMKSKPLARQTALA